MPDPIALYDRIAGVYDRYHPPWDARRRRTAVGQLALKPGASVLVPGCGTGFDLPLLVEAVGENGRIIALDASGAMLAKAQAKVAQHRWDNVTLLHEDASNLSPDFLWTHASLHEVDALLFSYVLTVMRDWESVFEKAFGLLRSGGRYAVIDGKTTHGPLRLLHRLYVTSVKRSGAGNPGRPVIDLLGRWGSDLRVIDSFSGLAFIATATKT